MTPTRLLYLFLLVLCGLRLLLIGLFELSPDESYYLLWSQHPALSYYSKGPGVAATIWISTHLFGPSEFGVRFFSPLLSLGTGLLMFRLARRLYGEPVALWTTVAMSCIPIYQVGGLLMTIDPLSMFFWTAALYTSWRALERAPSFSPWWPGTGALIGLGFLCKWTNAMQLLSILLLLLCTPRHRRELVRPGFWSMLAAFVPFAIPPLVWNSQNMWITFSHLTARAGLEKAASFDLQEFGTFLLGQFGVYSPLIFAAMLAAVWLGGQRARVHFKPRFLLAFALPILVLYFALSLREAGEANWTAPATLSLGLLAVALLYDMAGEHRWLRPFGVAALLVGLGMSLFGLNSDLVRLAGFPLPYERDPSARLRGWQSTAEIVNEYRSDFEKANGPVFMIGNKYQTAAILAYYMKEKRVASPGHPAVYIPESQAWENQFSFWPRYEEMTEASEIAQRYITSPNADPALKESIARALQALPKEGGEEDPRAADLQRNLVRELHKAMPELPLDEAAVEEQGVSLFQGRTALYVTDRQEERAPSSVKNGFEKVEMVRCINLARRGLPLRQIRIFACYNYHGASL